MKKSAVYFRIVDYLILYVFDGLATPVQLENTTNTLGNTSMPISLQ